MVLSKGMDLGVFVSLPPQPYFFQDAASFSFNIRSPRPATSPRNGLHYEDELTSKDGKLMQIEIVESWTIGMLRMPSPIVLVHLHQIPDTT